MQIGKMQNEHSIGVHLKLQKYVQYFIGRF